MDRCGMARWGKDGQGKACYGLRRGSRKAPFSCYDCLTKPIATMTQFSFANASKLKFDEVNRNCWPQDEQDRPLVFHPLDVYRELPPDAEFASKAALATALIELSRSIHYMWVGHGKEIDNPILLLKQYIQQIYKGHGDDEVRWVIKMASLTAPSCECLLDLAADGVGSWKA